MAQFNAKRLRPMFAPVEAIDTRTPPPWQPRAHHVALHLALGLALMPFAAEADIIGVSGAPGRGGAPGQPGGDGGNGAVAVVVTDASQPFINEQRLSGGAGGGGGGGGGGGETHGGGAPGGSGGQGGHGVELRVDDAMLINQGLLQGGAGGGGGGGGGSAYSSGSIRGGRGGDGIGGAGGGGGGGGDIPWNGIPMKPGDGGNAGQPGGVGTKGDERYGGGGGGAGGSNNPFGCRGTGPDSGCGGMAGAGGGTAYGAAGGLTGNMKSLNGEDAADATEHLTGGGGGGGAAPGGLGGKGGQALGGPPAGAGGTSIGGYGIHVLGARSHIINAGRIVPGVGAAQAVAIMYEPSANDSVLRLLAGSDIVGAVDATRSRNNRLILDGPGPVDPQTGARRAFDVSKFGALGTNVATTDFYQGFTSFEKTADGTWELRNTPTQARTPWTLTGGVLAVHGDEQLGSVQDAVRFNGGTLQILDDADIRHDLAFDGTGGILVEHGNTRLTQVTLHGHILGAGTLVKVGPGGLTVLSDNDFRGMTRVGTTRIDGPLNLGNGGTTGSLGTGPIEINSALVINRSDALTLRNPISGHGDLTQNGDGTTTLKGPISFAGRTYIDRGTLRIEDTTFGAPETGLAAILSVHNMPGGKESLEVKHAVVNGWMDSVPHVLIDRTSDWNIYIDDRYPDDLLPHHSAIGALTLAGRANFLDPRPQGQAIGRSVLMDRLIGQNGAVTLYVKPTAHGVADYLVLKNGATGTTRVALKMQGTEGADPLEDDGILIVASGGKTDNAFVQDGQSPNGNRSGAFVYGLRHGGRVINGVARHPDNWYLTSEVRPEVSIYSQLGMQAARQGELAIGTLNARMGATETLADKVYPYAWARLLTGVDRDAGAGTGLLQSDVATRSWMAGVQAGADVYVQTQGLSRRSAGLFFTGATTSMRVDHYWQSRGSTEYAGRSQLNTYGIGAYYTRFGAKGGYLDLVTQLSRIDVRTRAALPQLRLKANGWGFALSAEVGKSFAWGAEENLLRVQPQAQLIYQHIELGNSSDAASAVGLPALDTLTARLGVRTSKTWNPHTRRTSTLWVTASVLGSLGRSASTYSTATLGRIAFHDKAPGPRLGLRVGYDRLVAKNAFLNLQASMEQGVGGARTSSYGGNVGLKILF
ncbi:autotransporter outer membrane beta-barrel domain-containing protein [Bordetella genomosp. 1]|uniref:Autotransporter domain-containing protein n=1 Tax=Bordetella genomosp. 1 TaxID=1395607 RepID=A0ABX4ETH9_9BORD|nr:autotransporter outer membrane beta-barrel domain-containing protein [Bordetella genomosp. 1]OZI57090.1 hypothetical protein CAL27_22840 [Bordetella genomosp. 1]